ncbi:MAG: MATE family efflux transporter [Paludibacteraceae bacterium]|nr:MATE family efflux transporter [Paludibacteraceae bacterium]
MYKFSEYKPFYIRNLKVAIPIMLSQLGGAIVQLVDMKMVTSLGTTQLASVSFAGQVFMIGFVLAVTILQSVTPLVGYKYVVGDDKNVCSYFLTSIVQSLVTSVLIVCVMLFVSTKMNCMGQDPDVAVMAVPYFKYVVWSLPAYMLFETLRLFLAGLGNTSAAMIITLISNLINILFNYLLIYGEYGFPEMGVAGAGCSTMISRLVMPIMLVVVILFEKKWSHYITSMSLSCFSKEKFKELFVVGVPISLRSVCEVAAFALCGVMVGWLGKESSAANQIANSMGHMAFMMVLGIGAATTIRVSHQFGRKDLYAVRMAGRASVHLSIVNNSFFGLLMILFRTQISSFFSDDPVVVDIASTLLVFAGIYQISDGLQCVGVGILNGLADVRYSMISAFLCYVLVNLPVSYFLGFELGLGAPGIWTGFIVSLSLAAVLFHSRVNVLLRRYDMTEKVPN